jgi:predicted nucleic acid-binding protein
MPRIYVDTSTWIATITGESLGAVAKTKFEQLADAELCLSDWVMTEFASAVALKRRRLELTDSDMQRNLQSFDNIAKTIIHLPIAPVDYMKAASLCREFTSNLRAADALHLAVALRHNCTAIFSLDNVLNLQAKRQGLELISI